MAVYCFDEAKLVPAFLEVYAMYGDAFDALPISGNRIELASTRLNLRLCCLTMEPMSTEVSAVRKALVLAILAYSFSMSFF